MQDFGLVVIGAHSGLFLKDLVSEYQDQNILLVDTIGYSSLENIPIVAVKISDNVQVKEDEPRVLFVGQVHAEEVLGIEVVLSLLMDLSLIHI